MSSLDYSTFSLRYALTPSQPASARCYPADPIQEHVSEDVIDSHICNVQRDDLPSSAEVTDRPRDGSSMLSGSNQGQGSNRQTFALPRPTLRSDSVDDLQGNSLCAQLGGFHFSSQYDGHEHATVDASTAISQNSSWSLQHSLHYPTPVREFVSPSVNAAGAIAEDARPEFALPHSDVSARIPTRRPSIATVNPQLGRSYEFGLTIATSTPPIPSMGMEVTPFLPGGVITSPSPPPTAYHDDDFPGADCVHAFTYAEQLPTMTHTPAYDSATQYSLDCQTTVQSLGGFQEAAHQAIISLDRRYATTVATPFPCYSSSQSPHDHPICGPPSFGTAVHAEELPRPGSAPPLIDSQMPFIGDAQAALQSPQLQHQHTAPGEHVSGRPQPNWYPQAVAGPSNVPGGQSPRSSPRRAGSIGHNSQKTPPGSRHLRRWSSVTNPALRTPPPFPSPLSPNIPFPRYPPSSSDSTNNSNNPTTPNVPSSSSSFSHFSPSAESESDDPSSSAYYATAAIVDVPETIPFSDQQQQQQPVMRNVIRCDGHRVDEDSWSTAFARPDKLLHVYECFWDLSHTPCGMWIEGDQSSVADHLALFHGFRGGEVTTRCLWRDCPKPHMKGTSIARHVVTHIGFRVKCHTCKHEFARVDACNRAHSRSGCLGVGQPMYGDLQRVLDARKVDPLLRPSKKRRTDE